MAEEIDWGAKREAWKSQVRELCDEVKKWAKEKGWSVHEDIKQISEDHVGSYEVPVLVLQSPQGRVHIDPIGCEIVGASGRVDIFTWPALNRMLLVRGDDRWEVRTDARVAWPAEWCEDTFFDIVNRLDAA
jgi:hypothetical protein